MKIYKLNGTTEIHDRFFPTNSLVLVNGKTMVVSTRFNTRRSEPLIVSLWQNEKWETVRMLNEYTEALWHTYRKMQRKEKKYNCEEMMKHSRKRKYASGGVRLTKFAGQVTDYECSKNPFHDFRRVWN